MHLFYLILCLINADCEVDALTLVGTTGAVCVIPSAGCLPLFFFFFLNFLSSSFPRSVHSHAWFPEILLQSLDHWNGVQEHLKSQSQSVSEITWNVEWDRDSNVCLWFYVFHELIQSPVFCLFGTCMNTVGGNAGQSLCCGKVVWCSFIS